MKRNLFITLTTAFFLVLGNTLFAQNIAGTYKMKMTGKQIYTDRTPVSDAVSGTSSFTITQNGDEITVQMSGFQSEWSAHNMSGRVGNNKFIAVLPSGSKSVYMIRGRVVGNNLEGEYAYIRYGDGNSGIVPGWTKVSFKAAK